MDDAETPDAANAKDDQARRAGLRLRDAEAVAATRRDMFGDGSLVHVLAGAREKDPSSIEAASPEPAETPEPDVPPQSIQAQDDQAEGDQPQDDQSQGNQPQDDKPQDDKPQDGQPQDDRPQDAEAQEAHPRQEAPDTPSQDMQSSGAAVPEAGNAGTAEEHDQVGADAPEPAPEAESPRLADESLDAIIDSFPAEAQAAPPESGDERPAGADIGSPAPFGASERGWGAGGSHSGQAPVSAIFNTLGTLDDPAAEMQPEAEAPASEPPGIDMPEADAPASGLSDQSGQGDQGEEAAAGAVTQGDGLEDASEGGGEPAADAPGLATGLLSVESGASSSADLSAWPPFPEPGPQTGASGPEPTTGPPFSEPPMPLSEQSELGVVGGAGAWPPFPEPPGAGGDPAPSESSVMPPFIELPATPADAPYRHEPPAAAGSASPYPSAPEGASPADSAEPYQVPPTYDAATAAPAPERDAAAEASAEATARIAAEATATAQALDDLQRLLDRSIPDMAPQQRSVDTPVPPPVQPRSPQSAQWTPQRVGDALASPRRRRAGVPLRLPPPDTEPGINVYLLGFLTGVALSVMAGLALYFLISTS